MAHRAVWLNVYDIHKHSILLVNFVITEHGQVQSTWTRHVVEPVTGIIDYSEIIGTNIVVSSVDQ